MNVRVIHRYISNMFFDYNKQLIIVDIDGTLADLSHRKHFVEGEKGLIVENWHKFTSAEEVSKDACVPNARRVLESFIPENVPEHEWPRIVFLTGRHEGIREATKEWLIKHLGPDLGNKELYMRPGLDDMRPATEYKAEVIEELVRDYEENNYSPTILAFDDDWYMYPVYERFGAIVFRAPDCWNVMFPQRAQPLPPEGWWRE